MKIEQFKIKKLKFLSVFLCPVMGVAGGRFNFGDALKQWKRKRPLFFIPFWTIPPCCIGKRCIRRAEGMNNLIYGRKALARYYPVAVLR